MINHATAHKELLHDIVSQVAVVDAVSYCSKLNYAVFPGALLSRVQIRHLEVTGSNLAIAIHTALFWLELKLHPWVPGQRGAVLTGLHHLTC